MKLAKKIILAKIVSVTFCHIRQSRLIFTKIVPKLSGIKGWCIKIVKM